MFWGIFVTKDGDALKFVSFELILDREIVLCAVREGRFALSPWSTMLCMLTWENFYLDDEELQESMEHDALHADMTTPSGIIQQSVMSGPRIHIMVVKKSKAIEKTQRGVLANNYQRSKTCAYTVASVFPLRKSLSSRTTQTRILIHTQTVSRGQQGFLRSLFQSSEAPLPP